MLSTFEDLPDLNSADFAIFASFNFFAYLEAVVTDPRVFAIIVDGKDTLMRDYKQLVKGNELLEWAHNVAELHISEESFFRGVHGRHYGKVVEGCSLPLQERQTHLVRHVLTFFILYLLALR